MTKCIVGDFISEGEGNGKKVSKKRAAELMLERLRQLPPVASAGLPVKPKKVVTGKKKSRNLIKVKHMSEMDNIRQLNKTQTLTSSLILLFTLCWSG